MYRAISITVLVTFLFFAETAHSAPDKVATSGDSLIFSNAETDSALAPSVRPEMDGYLSNVVWVSIFFLFTLALVLWLFKKFILKYKPAYLSNVRVISKQNISTKQAIVIVSIEGKKYALGATDHALNLIAELGEVTEEDNNMAERSNQFGQLLQQITGKEKA